MFILIHNNNMLSFSRILVLESCGGGIKIICGIGITNLGLKVTKVTTSPLQVKPSEMHQKELREAIKVYKKIQKKEVVELL